jgi:hypothetical protein
MWWDADIDAVMRRTAEAPGPVGPGRRGRGAAIGLALSGFSVVMLGLATNLVAAGLLAFTIFFYAVVYTMWLKRWTPQNIVIGGAAGAFPPMIGWAAATGGVSIEAVLMFALIFMWTPPHFWALALFMRSDYDDAGVPMLTVTHGRPATRAHILAYTVLLAPVSVGLALHPGGGPVTAGRRGRAERLVPEGRRRDLAPRRSGGRGGRLPDRERTSSGSRSTICSCISERWSSTGRSCPSEDLMAIKATHEIHQRRLSRNLGVGLALLGFVAVVFGLTMAKIQTGASMQGFDHSSGPNSPSRRANDPAEGGRRTAAPADGRRVPDGLARLGLGPVLRLVLPRHRLRRHDRRVGGGAGRDPRPDDPRPLRRVARRDMPWTFKPVERTMEIRLGEVGLAFYEAHNPTDRPVAGTASYNVAPFSAGGYFSKIDCFCFEMQVLQPGETVLMPVTFYVDPEILVDREARHLKQITLSYTFHVTDLPEDYAAAAPAPRPDLN